MDKILKDAMEPNWLDMGLLTRLIDIYAFAVRMPSTDLEEMYSDARIAATILEAYHEIHRLRELVARGQQC